MICGLCPQSSATKRQNTDNCTRTRHRSTTEAAKSQARLCSSSVVSSTRRGRIPKPGHNVHPLVAGRSDAAVPECRVRAARGALYGQGYVIIWTTGSSLLCASVYMSDYVFDGLPARSQSAGAHPHTSRASASPPAPRPSCSTSSAASGRWRKVSCQVDVK